MINPDKDIYKELDKILGNQKVSIYFLAYDNFIKRDLPIMVNYYNNGSSDLAKKVNLPITNLHNLLALAEDINAGIIANKTRLKNAEFWEAVVQIEDMRTFLYTARKTDKYARASSILNTNVGGAGGLLVAEGIIPNDSIENILSKKTFTNDPDNEWSDIALANNLSEEDYGLLKGSSVTFIHPFASGDKIYLNSIVDNMDGEKMLGRDIQRYIRYENNDLVCLEPYDTLVQSVEVLTGLEIGDVPEYPNLGFESPVGQNINTTKMLIPSILRKLRNNFDTDDSITNFTPTNTYIEDDSLYIEFSVESVLGATLNQTFKR